MIEAKRMSTVGRMLCLLGFHRWRPASAASTVLTSDCHHRLVRCARCGRLG
jgi:hypothetical protein